MANTISTKTYRDKYRKASLAVLLRKALVAEKIAQVDRSKLKTLQNPYSSQATAVVDDITGRYDVQDYQTIDDTLTVDKEVKVAEHIYDFEMSLTNFDIFASRVDEQHFSVAYAIDKYVLNVFVRDAGQTYVTPSGAFQTAANLPQIVANLFSKVMGFADAMYRGCYLVLENTDIIGVLQQEFASGFSFADTALRNGFVKSYGGVDLYVVRQGTFSNYSAGSVGFQNQSKRLFGVKGVNTYATPRDIRYEEKRVSRKTGKEVVTYGYIGAKVWREKQEYTIAVVLTANPSPSLSASPSASVSPSASASPSPSPS